MKASQVSYGKFGLAALALAATTLMSACGGGGGGGGSSYDPHYNAWYNVYGNICGHDSPSPGCNYYRNGYKIVDLEDPYFKTGYYLEYDTWYYYDSYGYSKTYTGWAWESSNGILYDDYGDALNNTDGQGRDFSADVALQEKNVVKSAAEVLAAKYGLSTEVSMKAALALKDYATLGKDRARTEADIADFTQRLYGVDMNKVKNALAEAQKGDIGAMEGLVDEAATNWATTPETMKEILKSWYGSQL